LATAIRNRRDADSLLLDAGDSTALGALAFATDTGRGQAKAFHEAVAPDAHVPGNHDFDRGPDWLAAFAAEIPGAWLAANVADNEFDAFDAAARFTVAGDEVAVVGVAHPETPSFCAAVDDVEFTDPVPAVRRAFDAADPVDHRVVLSHCGVLDSTIARKTGADVVVGGHDHSRTVDRVAGTLVCRGVGTGRELLEVTLDDPPTASLVDTAAFATDPDIADEYRARLAAAGLDERLGDVGKLSVAATGQLVAEAYRSGAGADAGLVVEASVREPLAGEVTTADVVGVVPFGSDLVTVALAGEELRDLLRRTRDPLDDTHGRAIWAGADVDGATVGGGPVDPDSDYRLGLMSYLPHSEVLPGVGPERIVENHGPQHEHVLGYVENSGTAPE
jgi:2',3'-cyclic-nucleotide 2'-phosphodiesterase (5'-nucleotidase family)